MVLLQLLKRPISSCALDHRPDGKGDQGYCRGATKVNLPRLDEIVERPRLDYKEYRSHQSQNEKPPNINKPDLSKGHYHGMEIGSVGGRSVVRVAPQSKKPGDRGYTPCATWRKVTQIGHNQRYMGASNHRRTFAAISCLISVSFASPAIGEAGEHDSISLREYEKNMLNVLVGVTEEGRRDNGVTLGLEYERRLSKSLGVGAVAEHVFGDIGVSVYAVPLFFHTGRWKFLVAPGIETGDFGTEFLVRIGGDYAFHVGDWEIAPGLDVDFVDGDQVLVLGLAIGKGF
jgi:hypothetical protein